MTNLTADNTIVPLNSKTQIVNADGTPTLFFQRWAQERSINISNGISYDDLLAFLATVDVIAGTGLSGGGALTESVTLNLENTAVTPGSYTNTNLTVDAQGRITEATNGSGGGGGGGGALGTTSLHLSSDTSVGGGWTALSGMTVDHDSLNAYPVDNGNVTVPAGANCVCVSAQLAWDNKGGGRLFAVTLTGGVSGSSRLLVGNFSNAPNEGLQSINGVVVSVTPGDVYNIYALSFNGGDHLTGSGSGNFGGPSRFQFEWLSSYP